MVMSKTIENGHDYVALNLVKKEIVNNLLTVQKILESLANDGFTQDDIKPKLHDCYDLLHQIGGALNILDFSGAALFAEDMKVFCKQIVDQNVEDVKYSLQVMMQAILQLPPYLDIIETEGHDIPIALLPLINEMRACYKADVLAEVELFSSKYYGRSSLLSDEELKEVNTEGLINLLRKLRQSLQLSLIDLIHGRNVEIAIDHLIKIFNYLSRLCGITRNAKLWKISQAFVICIDEKLIPNDAKTVSLLKQIDLQIKYLIEQGIAGMNMPAPDALTKELLFLIAQVDSSSDEIKDIKKKFCLNNLVSSADDINIQQAKLTTIDHSALNSVIGMLNEEFVFIKDSLDILARTENMDNTDALLDTLKRMAKTLQLLGLNNQKVIINQQYDLIKTLIADNSFDKTKAMDIAEVLLEVENVVKHLSTTGQSQDEVIEAESIVINEMVNLLSGVKELLSCYFNSNGEQRSCLDETIKLLADTTNVLLIISQTHVAAVVSLCAKCIQEKLIDSQSYPPSNEVNEIVSAIAGVDYYLECLSKNQALSTIDALALAVKALAKLGYELPEDYESFSTHFASSFATREDAETSDENRQEPKYEAPQKLYPPKDELQSANDDYIDAELVEIFVEEMQEILVLLSTQFPIWIENTDNNDALIEIRRSFHTIKGSGRMVKAFIIGELGWAIENMLNRVLDKTITATPPLIAVIEDVIRILPELINEFATNNQHERKDVDYFSRVAHALANKQALPTQDIINKNDIERAIVTEPENKALIVSEPILTSEETIKHVQPTDLVDFDAELVEIFVAEAQTHMQVLKAFIKQCEVSLPQVVTDSLQRAMHTLKGSALMASLDSIANIAKPFEGFLKECSINAWPIERIDLELLRDASALLTKGIHQLELFSLAPVEGTDSLVERIRLRREYLLSQLTAAVNTQLATPDIDITPAEIVSKLMQQVDLLLDVEDNIKTWRSNTSQEMPNLAALQAELKAVNELATLGSLKPIRDLTAVLIKAYEISATNIVIRKDTFFNALAQVHAVLLNCIDQLAAAQVLSSYPDEIRQLETILDTNTEASITPAQLTQTQDEKEPNTASIYTSEDKLILGAPAPVGPLADSGDEIDPELLEIFIEEADDIVELARKELDAWIIDQDSSHLYELQRQLHTLKGGARMCGAISLGDIAHGLEFIYEGLLSGTYKTSPNLYKLLTKAHIFIQELIDILHSSASLPTNPQLLEELNTFRKEGDVIVADAPSHHAFDSAEDNAVAEVAKENVIDLIPETVDNSVSSPLEITEAEKAIVKELVPEAKGSVTESISKQTELTQPANNVLTSINTEPEKVTAVELTPIQTQQEVIQARERVKEQPKEVVEQIKVSADLLDNLVNLAGETSIYRSRIEQQNTGLSSVLFEMETTIERVRDQLRRLDTETQAQILSRHQVESKHSYTDFDPLEMDQYSQLQQLSRSLFESASDLQDLKETLVRRNRDLETLLQQQARINTELQESLMRTRMVPLDRIAPRLRRLVRQVSLELGKDVELLVDNTAGEMDRGVLDAIVAPLEHMIRNALDHGIETKEARLSAGKPAKGTINLSLIREGGEMVLRLKDDGAGISVETVRKKAIAKGLMGPEEALSDREILQFILEAGFSTATKVTQISGRGVGLDVVISAVKQLGGSLSLTSEEGKGTSFSIRLPINLSVSRALMVRLAEDSYAIPMSTVEGVTYMSTEQQREYLQFGIAELEYGNVSYRVKYLDELLGGDPSNTKAQVVIDKVPVLLVRSGEHHIALIVDELLTSSEIVVKSLGVQFLSVPAISGATILGDGKVIIILDLSALVRTYYTNQNNKTDIGERRLQQIDEHIVEVKRPPLVMVVDDSVTVRKVTTRLLERQGMRVITARDGVDAITQLDEQLPDIMLLDIEMPRMDGFEVATRVRHDERTKDLPIIMITSRSGDKHRERALEIGVNEYMSKPFMDAKLIKSISDLLPSFEVNLLESSS